MSLVQNKNYKEKIVAVLKRFSFNRFSLLILILYINAADKISECSQTDKRFIQYKMK